MKGSAVRQLAHIAHVGGGFAALRPIFSGRGAILMFHEVQDEPATELMTGTSTAKLESMIVWVRRRGWEPVTMDEALQRLSRHDDRRFVVVTFDDGYRDNLKNALPVLERHQVPFTLYVPSSAIAGGLFCWWLGLREMFRSRDVVEIVPMERRFLCADLSSKERSLTEAETWIHQDRSRASLLGETFARAGINLDHLRTRYFLNENELRDLARHPLVTIGAHGVSHTDLTILDAEAVRSEMDSNATYLEALTGTRVTHFAYPFGAAGKRESAISGDLGFASAVRASGGPVRDADATTPFLLPRIGISERMSAASFNAAMSGLTSVWKQALRHER